MKSRHAAAIDATALLAAFGNTTANISVCDVHTLQCIFDTTKGQLLHCLIYMALIYRVCMISVTLTYSVCSTAFKDKMKNNGESLV